MDQGYTHKKQTGGSGQFAKVLMNFGAARHHRGQDLRVREQGHRRHISANSSAPIEAGVKGTMESGVLAGFPVVGVKATVTDGQMHPVDSSKWPSSSQVPYCFKEAAPKASRSFSNRS